MGSKFSHLGESFKEWSIRVPQRWWGVLNISLTTIPLITGIIFFLVWAGKTEPPLPWWIVGLVLGGAILFIILSFLAFHRIVQEREGVRNENERLLQERAQQKIERCPLIVSECAVYPVGDGSQWLRLKVKNPNETQILGCYGKLLDRKMVGNLSKVATILNRQGNAKSGNVSLENWKLPPEGRRYPRASPWHFNNSSFA